MKLRPYQQETINQIYGWFNTHAKGHLVVNLPTGSGKSHIIATLCKEAGGARVLMLTHSKELIKQNAEKLVDLWESAPVGIYSAGLKLKNIDQITFGSIQSLRNKAALLGHIDIALIDEAHMISHKEEGGYRKLISELTYINSNLRVIGLTATPWRLGHGVITDGDALFDGMIEPVSIMQLIVDGYLAPLRSKATKKALDTSKVHKRGGEFIESELQKAVDQSDINKEVAAEIVDRAAERKHWLIFCAGIDHALHIAEELLEMGVTAAALTSKTSTDKRDQILADFKSGKIKAVTNANILTTGFDFPGIDCVAFLRPTMSPTLYAQMAGRGLRISPDKKDCLVLDFAGLVSTHGAITNVVPPSKKGEGDGDAPVKICDECFEIVHLSAKVCPACGAKFPEIKPDPVKLHHDDIMGGAVEMEVTSWQWSIHIGKKSGKEMLLVRYYDSNLLSSSINEYLVVQNDGWAGNKARVEFSKIAQSAKVTIALTADIKQAVEMMSKAKPPAILKYKMDGKYPRVLERKWN